MPVEDSNYAFSLPDTTSKIHVEIGGNIASCIINPIPLKMEVRVELKSTSASAPMKNLSAPSAWKISRASGSTMFVNTYVKRKIPCPCGGTEFYPVEYSNCAFVPPVSTT